MNQQPSPILEFHQVSKRFTFTPDRPQTLLESVIARFRGRGRTTEALWAVRDVSFAIQPGQSVGFIGRNGSGKSTLLKLATRIIRPTLGEVMARGRMGALLELGAGFHPDLTGRENIFLNGSVLGLGRPEIARQYAAIVDFAELADFIDMPVKHYSSGMYMRLGFSVAVHTAPDILLVDEILAVGDQAFQEKCIQRIHTLKRAGVTVIIVSHHLALLQDLCDELIWMEQGRIRERGATDRIIARYVDHMRRLSPGVELTSAAGAFRRWGSQEVQITSVRLLNQQGDEQLLFKTGEMLGIEITFVAHQPVYNPEIGLAIYREDGLQINAPNSRLAGLDLGWVEGGGLIRYQLPAVPLLPATYLVTVAIHNTHQTLVYDLHDRAYQFRIEPGGSREIEGIVALPAVWDWTPQAAPAARFSQPLN